MSTAYISEIRAFSFGFPPRGWARCDGALLPINQYQALFSLLGTTYGGNGQTNFGLPDLRGRVPMHAGSGFVIGQAGGEAAHTLTSPEMPNHNHVVNGTKSVGDQVIAGGNLFANVTANLYASSAPNQPVAAGTVGAVGGSQPHTNLAPYLVLTLCIALQGIFPSRN